MGRKSEVKRRGVGREVELNYMQAQAKMIAICHEYKNLSSNP